MASGKLLRLIASCYNGSNKIISNSNGFRKAEQALLLATTEGIGFEDFIKLNEDYLRSNGCSQEHIDEQMKRIRAQML